MATTETPRAGQVACEYWDSVADRWMGRPRDAVWRAHTDATNGALLDRWLPARPLERILKTDLFDEAVATGLYPLLQRRARAVTGFDISPTIVEAARAQYPNLDAVVANALRLPFNDRAFDAIVSISTLDHLDSVTEIRVALLELHRVLVRGGNLVLTLDNGSNPVVALRNRVQDAPLASRLVPYRMGPTCTAAQFAGLLRSCSFDVSDVSLTVHCPRVLAIVAARVVERASIRGRRGFLRLLASWELLDRWPTRRLTGYFVAGLAVKR